MTDAELQYELDRLRRQDAAAFERLYAEWKTPIYTLLLRITQDRCLAEDLFQEFFVRLWQSPPAADTQKPRAYLFRSARNLALDALRKRRPEVEEAEAAAQGAPLPERLDLEAAIGALSLAERQLVVLHLNAGFTFRELAALMGEPLPTVYARYKTALKKMKAMLREDEVI